MKINIYYGGRGLIDDPTLYAIEKMESVFRELRVTVERFMLYDMKNSITMLPQTLKDADGIILATTVEWYGIGGYMMQFLDACWLYGDKEKIAKIYMCPVVMSTTYGERDGELNMASAWEILGGRPCSGLCGYIEDIAILENNEGYAALIEKTAEDMYRTINKKVQALPASNQAVNRFVSITKKMDLTPKEAEQLSQYASDDSYVQKSKEDIRELTSIFRNKLDGDVQEDREETVLRAFRNCFRPIAGFRGTYKIVFEAKELPLCIDVKQNSMTCGYGQREKVDVEMQMTEDALEDIVQGRISFQRSFMSGAMKMKGDFKLLRQLDQLFVFG